MMCMDNILKAKLGDTEDTDILKVNYKKTINIRQYESEVSEIEITLKVPNNISGAERILILAVMQAQAEYEAYSMLAFKNQIMPQEFEKRKAELVQAVASLTAKAESVTGLSMKHIIEQDK